MKKFTKTTVAATLIGLLTLAFATSNISAAGAPDMASAKKVSVGLGFGIPYGVLGSSFDINVAPQFDVSLGFGTTVLAGAGYNVGVRYYLAGEEKNFRPRLSANYGTNAMVQIEDSYGNWDGEDWDWSYAKPQDRGAGNAQAWRSSGIGEDAKSYTGLSLGLGARWMWGQNKAHGLDFDVILIATTGLDIDKLNMQGYDVSEPGRVKISLGYRLAF